MDNALWYTPLDKSKFASHRIEKGTGNAMMKIVKKIFGEIQLSWPKVILAAVITGFFTAAMALIPELRYTSFNAITVTFEVWILFGILIIMNSSSQLDSALKCFVFFLISQPLVYLFQVPFSNLGWALFGYYKYWFLWTLLCFPMGFIGYLMKKGKWWGFLILLPAILLTGYSYLLYFSYFLFSMPRYALICLFCVCAMIVYPVAIFDDKKIQSAGVLIGSLLIIALTIIDLRNPPIYSTEIMANGETYKFDNTYTAYLADDKFGDVKIIYMDSIESYMLHADFKRSGDTVVTLVSPGGEETAYGIHIERNKYEIKPDTSLDS